MLKKKWKGISKLQLQEVELGSSTKVNQLSNNLVHFDERLKQ